MTLHVCRDLLSSYHHHPWKSRCRSMHACVAGLMAKQPAQKEAPGSKPEVKTVTVISPILRVISQPHTCSISGMEFLCFRLRWLDLTILILGLQYKFMVINVGLPAAKEGSEFKRPWHVCSVACASQFYSKWSIPAKSVHCMSKPVVNKRKA